VLVYGAVLRVAQRAGHVPLRKRAVAKILGLAHRDTVS
jgi:hypothetical protein